MKCRKCIYEQIEKVYFGYRPDKYQAYLDVLIFNQVSEKKIKQIEAGMNKIRCEHEASTTPFYNALKIELLEVL